MYDILGKEYAKVLSCQLAGAVTAVAETVSDHVVSPFWETYAASCSLQPLKELALNVPSCQTAPQKQGLWMLYAQAVVSEKGKLWLGSNGPKPSEELGFRDMVRIASELVYSHMYQTDASECERTVAKGGRRGKTAKGSVKGKGKKGKRRSAAQGPATKKKPSKKIAKRRGGNKKKDMGGFTRAALKGHTHAWKEHSVSATSEICPQTDIVRVSPQVQAFTLLDHNAGQQRLSMAI